MFGGGDSGVRPDCRAVPAWLALLSEASRQRTARHRPGTQGGLSSYYYLIPSGETRGRLGVLYPSHHTTMETRGRLGALYPSHHTTMETRGRLGALYHYLIPSVVG